LTCKIKFWKHGEFACAGQLIAVERQRKERIADEIKRAKSMPDGGSHWTDDRQKGRVWADDPVDMTEHAGDKTTKQKLHLDQLLNMGQIAALASEAMRSA
jgi:hypothetical protein